MKARSDSVPAWPFALVATGVILLLLAETRSTQPRTQTTLPHPAWGEPAEQLQLAATLDSDTGFVAVWLRSVATNDVFIHNWGVGYIESIEPEMRVGDRWVQLRHSPNGKWAYHGIGPRTHDIIKLAPKAEFFWRPENEPTGQGDAYLMWLANFQPVDLRVYHQRWQAIRRIFGSPTFMLSLEWFDWPASITQQSRVTIRTKQRLALPLGVRVRTKNADGTSSYEPNEERWTNPPPPYVAYGCRWVELHSQPIEFDPAPLAAVLKARRQP